MVTRFTCSTLRSGEDDTAQPPTAYATLRDHDVLIRLWLTVVSFAADCWKRVRPEHDRSRTRS